MTLTTKIANAQVECGITRTTPQTHAIIRANVHRSPMYSGQIQSRGPRYCPSIEDKIVRFGERDGHQIFLEPKASTTPPSIRTASRRRCRRRCNTPWSLPFPASNMRAWCGQGMPSIRLRRSTRTPSVVRNQASARAISGRPNQRHDRLRRGCGTGTSCRSQRRFTRRRRGANRVRSR